MEKKLEEAFNLDFDMEDTFELPDKASLNFATNIKKLFDELLNNEFNESFTSYASAENHFNKHCLGEDKSKKSRRQCIYYDFKTIEQFLKYEIFIKNLSKTVPVDLIISELDNEEEVETIFRKLFMGNTTIRISPAADYKKDNKFMDITLHSFANNVTTNYTAGNTIDLRVQQSATKTITLYPVDANYLETRLNNIIKIYLDDKQQLKINRG